jgi:hypothetical protein
MRAGATGTAVLVYRIREVNDDLVGTASRLAMTMRSRLVFIGVSELALWVESGALLAGVVSARQLTADLEAEIGGDVRRCVSLLRCTVSAQHMGWPESTPRRCPRAYEV